jgi:hypothetical protein
MWEWKGAYRVLWGSLRQRDQWEDQCIDGRIILKWIFKKWDEGHGLD